MKKAKNFSKCLAFFLLSVAVFSLTASGAFADVAVDVTHFYDDNFREAISSKFDMDGDGILTDAELAAVTEIDVGGKGIKYLNGIQYFTNLKVLSCDNNYLTKLNLSKNSELEVLNCSHNSLKQLDLRQNLALVTIDCSYNKIDSTNDDTYGLHLENLTALVNLDWSNTSTGGKKRLYLNGCSSLTSLNSIKYDYNLSTLDISGTSITSLSFSNTDSFPYTTSNVDTCIYAKDCTNLESVTFVANNYAWRINDLDFSGCTALTNVSMNFGGLIRRLIFKDCTALQNLQLENWAIDNLDLSGCTSLVYLNCQNNPKKWVDDNFTLNLSGCTSLKEFYCKKARLTELDVRDCIALEKLDCSSNDFYILDLRNNTKLTSVSCDTQKSLSGYVYNSGNSEYPYKYSFPKKITTVSEWYSLFDEENVLALPTDGGDLIETKFVNGVLMFKKVPMNFECDIFTGYQDLKIHHSVEIYGYIDKDPPVITTTSLKKGTKGLSYLAELEASGTTPITWSIYKGTLPYPLDIDSPTGSTGCISGIPVETGTFEFTVQAKNSAGTDWKVFTIVIGDISDGGDDDEDDEDEGEGGTSSISKIYSKPKITTETLFEGTVGLEYGYILKAEGTMPIIWGLAYGEFPAGLTLKQDGQITQITGTPTMSGDFTFTVQAQNDVGISTKDLTIRINPAPEKTKPTILTSELEPAIVGENYGCQLMASGTPPIKWSITKPKKFSAGMKDLEFSSSGNFGGIITRAQKVKITVRAENEYGSFSKIFTLQSYIAPNINLTSFKDAKVWKKYTGTFKTKPTATKPLTWTLAGALPSGFIFDSSKGKITGTGTPENYGAYPLIIKVSNPASEDIKSFTFNVSADLPKITLKSLPKGTDGKAYKAVVKASGTKPVSFDIVSGYSLPDGLSFDSETGKFSGTPTATCTDKKIKIKASNVAGETVKDYYLTIKAVAPKFTTKSLESGMLNTAYSASVDIAGTKPFKVSVSGLPAGLQFNADESVITGTPTESGTFNVTLTASNSVKSMTKKFKLVIYAPPSFNDNATLPAATADKAYKKFKFNMSGTQKIILQFDSGVLPEGMSIAPSTGSLSGKPKAAGTFTFTVKATNVYGSATKEFNLTVNAVPPKISGSLKSGKVGNAYSSKLKVKGTAPMNWVVDGAIPEGLDFVDGVLSGTPTAAFDGYMTITASNASYPGGGKDTKFFRLKITGTTTPTTTTDSKSVSEIETPAGTPASDAEKDSENAQKLFVGNPRKISDVKNLKLLDSYKIAAVLPEISVSESGLYELEVEISEDIEIGEKLIYLALPQNSEPSEDDEIAEFYNLDGEEISTVPENHKIILGAWFNENIIYAPVIAVKKE